MYNCALCAAHACNKMKLDEAPKNCPSLNEAMNGIKESYNDEENFKIAKAAAQIVEENYGRKTRLEEIMDFAKQCNYKK